MDFSGTKQADGKISFGRPPTKEEIETEAITELRRLKAIKAKPTTIEEIAERMEQWEKLFGI
jgi:hypothetical protein